MSLGLVVGLILAPFGVYAIYAAIPAKARDTLLWRAVWVVVLIGAAGLLWYWFQTGTVPEPPLGD
jgi:hypothetical protein